MGTSALRREAPRFLRYAAISLPTFLLDLGLLVALVRCAHLGYVAAAVLAFLAATTLSYLPTRMLVFSGSSRGMRLGYVYFLAIGAVSILVLALLMWALVGLLHLNYVVSRVLTACIVGVGSYATNRIFNFRGALKVEAG